MGIFDRLTGRAAEPPAAEIAPQPVATVTGNIGQRELGKAAAQRDRFARAIAQCTRPDKLAELEQQHDYWTRLAELAAMQKEIG